MPQSIQIPVTQVGLEESVRAAMKRVGNSTQINLGTNSKQINALSQPLGRITGQADEFSKSMAAANARVLAFGASAGIIAGVSTAMGALLTNTIKVEKSLIEIGSVLNKSGSELDKYGQQIFSVAKNTGQSFDIVAEGALELSRQGLNAEDTLKRLNDALILSRLSGLDAKQSVEGLTAALNSFKSSGETSATILNKLVAVSQEYAVSERDLIESIKRSASVADLAGVSFNELAAITTAIQQKTARGGAVIGNSLKTIFARIQDKGVLDDLDNLGINVIGASGKALSATDVLKNLAGEFEGFSKIRQADIAEKLGGVYQLDKLLAALKDLGQESSVFGGALKEAINAGNKAYEKNAVLNQSLSSLINKTTLSAQELGATLGKIGVTDSLKNVLGFFNSLIEGIQKILGEEGALGGLVKGLVKGIGAIFAGPGLILFGAIILKLSKDLVQFGFASLKIFFGVGKAAKEVQNVEGAISQILARNVDLQQQLFAKEGNRAAQLKIITSALIEQEAILRRSSAISSGLAEPLYNVGGRAADSGLRIQPPRAAAGYMPATAIEKKNIQKGVGGAKSGDKPVTIPNFNFGGGKKGAMVAHTGEYIVPNFAGSGGSAIFNRDMVRSMGLPEGAKKINAAGGFIPNFAKAKVPSVGAPIGEFVDYFGGQKESDTYAAIKRLPDYFESQKDPKLIGTKFNEKFLDPNRIAGAIKKSITRAPFEVDANSIPFANGNGLGVVTLNKATEASYGKIKLKDEDLAKIGGRELVEGGFFEKKFLNTLKQEGIDPNQVSQFREQFKQKNIKLGSEGDELNNELRLNNIRVSDFSRLQGYGKEKQEQFQKRINTIFAGPLAQLTKEVFGGALGNVDESMMTDKYLFGTDVLGNIFESAINLYTKGAANLPSFKEGEAKRSANFDFPLNNADQAKRLNEMFFPGNPIGRADAKYTAGTSDLQDIVSKSLNDPQALAGIQKQIKLKANLGAANGFIPNFVNQKYVMETLARIKAGTSGFSKQEQETFLNKFGAKSTGRKMSIRDVYDKLDGEMGISQLIDAAYRQAGPTASNEDVFKIFEKQIKANPNQLRSLVSQKGFVPNFVDPLKEAIGREMSAGVPASQIYVDKNSSLKNAMNPMGLMVANRRDEPAGGFQGISRARKEGANPMMYGAASGFIPNYANIATAVSKETGIGIKDGPVKDALNKFARDTQKAGADIQSLSEALEKQITALTQNTDASKKITEAAKKEIEQKQASYRNVQESLAQKTLEKESNKKITKQLDKIYLEYNKSQKTAQDLTNAQAKAAAILQKTSLAAGTKQAVVASTGSLASARANAQPRAGRDRDMLGAIFGLQAAFSGLTGATEGLENGFFQALNSVSAAAGTATTSLFAVQGLSQVFGGAETKIGGFLGKLGPYAAGIGFLYTGFNELTKYLDKTNPSIQKASESMLMVSDAANKASVNLNNLNPIQQERVRKRAKDVIEQARTYTDSTAGYNPYGIGSSTGNAKRLAGFEGVSNELKTGFEKIISESLAAGISETELEKLITSKFQSGSNLTSQEVQDISKELNVRLSKISGEFSQEKIIQGLTKEQKGLLQTMSPQDLEKEIANRGKEGNPLKFLQDALYGTKDNPGITNDVARQENIRKIYGSVKEQADVENKAEEEAVKQTSVALAQDKLKNALAIAIAKARSFENDQLAQTLLSAQELGNLDEKGLRDIQDRIALREIDRKLTDETSSIIQSQIDKAKEITANSEKALELESKFQLLTEEDLRNPEKLKEILAETNALLSQGEALTTKEAEALDQKINALIENNGLEKDSLKLNQQKTDQFKEQAKQLDLISQASKRALEAQSFNREIATTKSINASDLQVRALESSKLGASDSQIRQIDRQVAAIKENTVALEQNNAREKIFSDFKTQLQENNKITDKAIKADVDNQIKEAKTEKQLQGLAALIIMARGGQSASANASELSTILQKLRQDLAQQEEASKQARSVAAGETADAGRIAPVISALEMFRRSLLETSQIIDQKIEDIRLQQLTSISGRELIQGNYDIETLRMQEGKTGTEAARIARERQNKSVSQLFNEEFGKTEEERALDMKKTIVDASVQFKNNMIEGIMGAVEGTSSLKDGLRSAAYEFVKAINQKMINNLIDKVVGGNVQSGSGQTSGGLVGFLSGMFGMASGGMINGGSGMKDDVPAMLMGGEYVVNKKAVSKYGAQFLESINNGTLTGYAKGGSVQKGPQGNFYTPGTFGQGAIEGKRNLLDFATQTGTSGQFDQIINESGYQSVSLEPESSRLSVSGMRNSPQFEATQAAKEQAFDLYLQQYNQEIEAKKAEEAQKKAFKTQLLMLAVSAGLGAVGSVASTGAKTALANLPKDAGVLEKLMTAASGAFKGGNIAGTGQMAGGLKNLFSGNFATAFRSGIPLKAGAVGGSYGNVAVGAARSGTGVILDGSILPQFNSEDKFGKTSGYYPSYQVFGKRSYLLGGGGFGSLLPPKNAIGGMIPSTSGIDTVPAMLSGGEFVMNRSAVQGIGAQNLQSMNSGGTSITSEETSKELNEKLLAKLDELINSSGSTGNITINVAPSGQTTQETSQDPSAGRQQLARQIKDAVLQIINDEKRIGGTLRR